MVSEVICRFESWESFERQSGVAAARRRSANLSHLTNIEKAKLEGSDYDHASPSKPIWTASQWQKCARWLNQQKVP
jgi:hypothetical protein